MIIGEGDASFVHHLKRMALDGAATVPIHWLGYVDDVASILRTCAVLVCPSHREPLGRVVLEAWAAGAVPIVFCGSGGAAEIVAAADGGIIYDVQEPHALMRALQRALALNGAERTRLVNNGRSWMHEHCDPRSYGQAILRVLSAACTSR
jgi:glycosyltransferase involved in cell wall biosynthesis